MEFSLVIPAYNEEESILPLYDEVAPCLNERFDSFEVIFVDDGSTDRTGERIADLANRDQRVRHFRLPRNSGKSMAYAVGLAMAKGELIGTIDADLQDNITELPKLLEQLTAGQDLVIGWKKGRLKNEPGKALPSFVFNAMLFFLFGLRLHDFNCGFRVMRSDVAKNLTLYGGMYRFIPVLAHVRGFKVCEVPVSHRKRIHGESKYGPARFWTGLLDLLSVRFITAYNDRPLHVFGTISLLVLLAGVGLETYVLINKMLGDPFKNHLAAIIVGAMLIMVAFQVLTTGLIGVMINSNREHRARQARWAIETEQLPPARSQGSDQK